MLFESLEVRHLLTGSIDDPPSVAVQDVTVTEGQPSVFNVSLSGPSADLVYVHYRTFGDSAAADHDFDSINGTLTFLPGQVEQTLSVPTRVDSERELTEAFTLELTGPAASTAVAWGYIDDDRSIVRVLSVEDVSVMEGQPASFAVTLSDPPDRPIVVHYQTFARTASPGYDYASASGTLTFWPWQTVQTVSVATYSDLLLEGDEFLAFRATGPQGSQADATATILDDPANVPALSVSDVVVTEGDAAVFTLSLSRPSANTITLDYWCLQGSATATEDFALSTGSVTFYPGSTAQEIRLSTYADLIREAEETFTLELAGGPEFSASALATILDDPTNIPALSVGDVIVTEGGTAVFTVALSGPSANVIQVPYWIEAGSATANHDFAAANGLLTFYPGQTQQTVSVGTYRDLLREPSETFELKLAASPDLLAAATGTILDDPTNIPALSVGDVVVTEGGTAVFIVGLSAASAQRNPGAVLDRGRQRPAGHDFAAAAGQLTFYPGQTQQTVSVGTYRDLLHKPEETFAIRFAASPDLSAVARGVILDDPENIPSLSVGDVAVTEGGTAVFTVGLSGASARMRSRCRTGSRPAVPRPVRTLPPPQDNSRFTRARPS